MLFSQDDKMRIMVLDFGGSGVEASLLIAAYEDLETKLIETNRFIVIDRSTRESRMSELKYQRSGCVTDECIIEIGRELSANYVVNGSINKIGKSFQINIKLVDMEQGEMTEKVTERVKGGEEELFDGIEKLSLELVRRIVSASGGGASAPVQSMTESTVTLAYGIIEVTTTPQQNRADETPDESRFETPRKLDLAGIGNHLVKLENSKEGMYEIHTHTHP